MKERRRGACKNRVLNEDNCYKWNKAALTFEAKVLEVQTNALIVEPLAGTSERELTESIAFNTENLAELTTVEYVKSASGRYN